jgi:hypothetical protein
MNRDKARELLDLPLYFNQQLLRKKYKIACLKYHPDKDKDNDGSLFLEVKDAYEYLNNSIHDESENDTNDILNQFDSNTLKYYVSILKFFKENIDYVINPVVDHLKKFEYYELHPTLEQLFNKSLYVLNDIYIPLWHHELTIENYKITIIPVLPDYVEIDVNNNIHVYLTIQSCHNITFVLGGVSFLINREQNIFLGQGIPIIQEKNIYNISKLSDVIFHIT